MKKTVLAAAIALLPVAALADSGLYAGFSIGRSIIEDAGSAGPGQSIEKNSTAYKLQLGYRINPNLAIEGGYLNLGKFAYAYRNGANTEDGEYKSHGLNLFVVGSLPVADQFSLFAKAGGIYARTQMTWDEKFNGNVTSHEKASTTQLRPALGLGMSYRLSDALSARVEYERYFDIGNEDTGKSDVSLISAGLTYAF